MTFFFVSDVPLLLNDKFPREKKKIIMEARNFRTERTINIKMDFGPELNERERERIKVGETVAVGLSKATITKQSIEA